MAMQHSDELAEVATVLFQQVKELGIPQWTCGFNIWETGDTEFTFYPGGPDGEILPSSKVPLTEHSVFRQFDESRKRGDELFVYEKEGEIQADHYRYMHSLPGIGDMLQGMLDQGFEFPKYQIDHIANFSHGNLLFITYEPFPEMHNVFIRFAKVFEQTYNRFLDLQKAEVQTREAQINLAVERVRAKALAMHKSAEIMEVVASLKDEVMGLDIPGVIAATIFLKEGEDKVRMWDLTSLEITDGVSQVPTDIIFKLKKTDPHLYIKQVWENQANYFVEIQDKKGLQRLLVFILEHGKNEVAKELAEFIETTQLKRLYHAVKKLNNGKLAIDLLNPPPDEMESILTKMGAAFDLAYKRFEDLQKAEAQAREAQIEAALEKLRNQSMVMQHSNEIQDLSKIFHDQLIALNIPSEFSYVWLPNEEKADHMFWATWTETTKGISSTNSNSIIYPLDKTEPYTAACYKAWQSNVPVHVTKIPTEETTRFFNTWKELIKGAKKLKARYFPDGIYYAEAYIKYGCFGINIRRSLDEEEKDILHRFSIEFERAYTRFLDLQKAEEQAREAQIEAALEKVRSRTMAMQKGEEIKEIVVLLYKELIALGVTNFVTCGYVEINEEINRQYTWVTSPGGDSLGLFYLPLTGDTTFDERYAAWKQQQIIFHQKVAGKVRSKHLEFAITTFNSKEAEEMVLSQFPDPCVFYCFNFSHGYLHLVTGSKLKNEEEFLLARFTKVFEQTYARFLDLQKAEAQAREAQIEAALERIRGQVTAMKASAELLDIVVSMRKEFVTLGHEAHYFWHMRWLPDTYEKAMTSGDGTKIGFVMKLPRHIHGEIPLLSKWEKSKKPTVVYAMDTEAAIAYVDKMIKLGDFQNIDPQAPTNDDIRHIGGLTFIMARTSHGEIGYSLPGVVEKPPAEDLATLVRFARAFDLAYKRFEDLISTERQTREAQIELALERVRSRTLAMHSSGELAETAVVLFRQLIDLGIEPNRLFITIINKESQQMEFWITNEDGSKVSDKYSGSSKDNRTFKRMFEGWQKKEKSLTIDLKGKSLQQYFAYLSSKNVPFKQGLEQKRRVQHIAYFSQGFIGMASLEPQTKETTDLLERFAAVFNLTYTRYHDLKVAEAQTREAQIETALERVRARALAMQEPEELKEVADVLRQEMGALGIEALETCSIYINDREANRTECWYAIKDIRKRRKHLVADHFALDLKETWVGRQMLKFYNVDHEHTSIVMKGKNRAEWIRYCEEKSAAFKGYYGKNIPDRTYHLYKFSHGAIGAATADDISEENWGLLRRAATVFSLAYSRFKDLSQAKSDLQKLKKAKTKAEKALNELKSTQTQLVHAEKMASLGELTAGIAHEIQNPLNFVNNFSELNTELIEEANQEMDEGNHEDVKEILGDIKDNELKISHHGKRAEGIVKGMLQHSRTNSGEKEPTDINMLADEYLRLSYHGLRAKDKSFNADFKTNFDESMPKVKVITQDLGRVILNLINNAFYAVSSFAEASEDKDYKPTVKVATKKIGDNIEISVIDNGAGIPNDIKDKIFQPFFTTKPTGSGTGLGLSMSYDIITKGHGRELKVESKEGAGSAFIINLPII